MGFVGLFRYTGTFLGTEEQRVDMATRGPEPRDKTQEIVATLQSYGRPFMGTGEVAEEMGYSSNPGVTKHLERAVEDGEIEKTTISGYNVWYLPDLVQESQIQTTGPAPGGGPPKKPDEGETDRDATFTAGFTSAVQRYGRMGDMWVPALAVIAAVAYSLWYGLQWFSDDDPRTIAVALALFATSNIAALSVILSLQYALVLVAGYLLTVFGVTYYASLEVGRTVGAWFGWGETV